jgi:hypothetical protein
MSIFAEARPDAGIVQQAVGQLLQSIGLVGWEIRARGACTIALALQVSPAQT